MDTRRITQSILSCSVCVLLPALGLAADQNGLVDQNGRVEIAADYRYAARESESVADAKALACREAWRLAVANSSVYRENTAAVVDSSLLRNLAYHLATNYVQEQQIVEQTQKGRTVGCQVHGYLPTEESVRVIRTQLSGSPPEGTEQNRAVRIISTNEEGGYVLIQFQALKRLDWLSTAYQGTLRESADIMVDFYGETGVLIRTERHPVLQSGSGQDVLNPGALGILKVPKPLGAKTYRAWLVK